MGKFLLFLGPLSISSAAFAFEGTCIYSDNKVATGKPNGAILTIPVSLQEGQSREIISLNESGGVLTATLSLKNGQKKLTVADMQGAILSRRVSDLNSSTNFLMSKQVDSESTLASIVCIPRE